MALRPAIASLLSRALAGAAFCAFAGVVAHGPALADPVAEFYKGKSIRMVMPTSPGGSTSLFGLAMAEHLPRFIPGNPSVAAEYRVGAGGLVAANYVYNAAPRDGTVITMLISGLTSEDTQPAAVRFETQKFNFIGRASDLPRALIAWHTSGLTHIDDARKVEKTVGASGRGSNANIHPQLINLVYGTKFKMVLGYGGAGATYLALERGEIDATTVAWDGLVAGRGDWLRDGKVKVLLAIGSRKFAGFENVPNFVDLARTPEDRALLEYAAHSADFGQVLAAPPGVPAERVQALRRAFDAMMKDKDFLALAKARKMHLEPMTGEQLQAFVERQAKRPKEVAQRLRAVAAD